jgi:hypothetical protein
MVPLFLTASGVPWPYFFLQLEKKNHFLNTEEVSNIRPPEPTLGEEIKTISETDEM